MIGVCCGDEGLEEGIVEKSSCMVVEERRCVQKSTKPV